MTHTVRAIIIIVIFATILFGVLFTFYACSQQPETSTIIMLEAQGQINTAPEYEVPIDILCFANKNNSLLNDEGQKLVITTDNNNLDVTEYSIEAGSQYKKIRLYAISLTVKASRTGNQPITQVNIKNENGKIMTFNVGEINISVDEPWTQNLLDVSGHTAGAGLGEMYECFLINKTEQTCTVTGINFGSLTPYLKETIVYVGGKQVDPNSAITLRNGAELTVKAEFRTNAGKDVFYVSPKIMYKFENTKAEHFYTLPHALLGIPVTEDKVKEIYEKFI